MKPLHICLLSETYTPEINGVALTVQNLAYNLIRLGQRVSLIHPRSKLAPIACPSDPLLIELETKGFALPGYPGLQAGFPAYKQVFEHLQKHRVDVLYVATEGPLGWAARRAARKLHIPLVTGFHTRFDQYMKHYGWSWLQGAARAYLRRFHSAADITLAPTEELTNELKAMGIIRAQHLPRGVDVQRFSPSFRRAELRKSWRAGEDTPVVIGVGRLAPEKNWRLLLDSYQTHFYKKGAKLVIVGDGPQRAELQKDYPEVIFMGQLLDQKLAEAYASADVFALPSLSETFGNVTLEAMASGLAIVAFDYGAAKAHVTHGLHGSTIACNEPNKARAFANALEYEIARWRLGSNVGAAARMAVQSMSQLRLAELFIQRAQTIVTQSEQSYGHLRKSYHQVA